MRDKFVLDRSTQCMALAGLLLGAASMVQAQGNWYFGADRTRISYDIAHAEFEHDVYRVQVGRWIEPGIGLEVYGSVEKSEDRQEGLSNEVRSLQGVNLRLQSPEFKPLKAYFTAGYAEVQLEGQGAVGNVPGRETFKGGSVGFGLLTPVWARDPKHWLGVEISGFSNGDGFSTTNLSVFYRFEP